MIIYNLRKFARRSAKISPVKYPYRIFALQKFHRACEKPFVFLSKLINSIYVVTNPFVILEMAFAKLT
jgi:hypothetical protein